jgi:23S rRNA pseudouridine1911/1915/1917 synthase
MPSVAVRHIDTHTVANFLTTHFPETTMAGARPLDAGLVHRLDTETSGLLLAARTPDAYAALREQFRDRTVGKDYIAVVEGQLKTKGKITLALAPKGAHGRRMHTNTRCQGQTAITFYTPVEHYPAHTVVRVKILTGVRHQIRAHLASLGHPIVGDSVYGAQNAQGKPSTASASMPETLTFRHPTTGQTMKISAPLKTLLQY